MREVLKRKDPYTGELFFPKRANQKFARPENRIKFNNDAANELRREREHINKPIHIAHVKLRKLMDGRNEAEFSIDFLRGYGLDFNVFNHYVLYNGIKRRAIFEFIIIIYRYNKRIKVIRHDKL
ncbi:hypothetical protein [Flavobacterium sp.]|uniref:hypothetical protein n=1 Tax=Flavobacterium sp. TaxID=239 RepID=UPI0033424A04